MIAQPKDLSIPPERRRGAGGPSGVKSRGAKRKWKKPYPTFPLTLHQSGQFCKKINGRILYFGSDQDTALRRYREQCEGLHSGKVTEVHRQGAVTVGTLVNCFMTDCQEKQQSGAIVARTFMDYYRHCKRLVRFFGKSRTLESLTHEDFTRLRQHLASGVSLVTLKGRVGAIRTIFEFAYTKSLTVTPLKRDWLKRPSRRELRKRRSERGRKYFLAEEIRKLLEVANTSFRAMILLGVNCGLGNTDIASLRTTAIDLENGWLDFARVKTGVDRRCPLWPETVQALRKHLAECSGARTDETAGLVFVTRKGQRYVRSVLRETEAGNPQLVEHDAIVITFKRVMAAAGVTLPGTAFYGLRHSCETFGGETGEQVAVDHIMGHAPDSNDMGYGYRGYVAEEQLRRVTDHVREKVLGVRARRKRAS